MKCKHCGQRIVLTGIGWRAPQTKCETSEKAASDLAADGEATS